MERHLGVLEKRTKIEGYVESVTALHIGAGRGMQATGSDLPVMMDVYGRPFIPGSSFKGSLRSQVEAALRAVAAQRREDEKRWSCDVIAEDYCISNRDDWQEEASFILGQACPVCKLFGAPYVASRVYIGDLMVAPETWDPLLLQVRDGVAIDRESLTAAEKKKFDLEVIPPGVRFRLEIMLENPTDAELGLLFWALQLYNDGYARLGGASSRGTGRVRLIITDMQTRSIADFFAPPREAAAPAPTSQPGGAEAPDEAQAKETKLIAALDKLREILARAPSMTVARLEREGPSVYGLSERWLQQQGVKNLNQLLKSAQERGLIRVEGQQIFLTAGPAQEEQPEQPREPDRLQEYLGQYLPALQRWVQGKDQSKLQRRGIPMFKRLENVAKLSFTLSPQGPILIKAGDELDPTGPDMAFMRLMTPAGRTICIPGSSLKGVMRSAAESLLRLVDSDICDASDAKTLCSGPQNENKKANGKLPYADHCRVCQTFGSTDLASRVHFSDLLPWRPEASLEEQRQAIADIEQHLGVRMNVSIDRRKSAVAHGPFEMETLSGGTLYGEVILRNYRLWQVGLIFFLFDQIDQGIFRLGFAKSRGLGRVRIQPTSLTVEQFGSLARADQAALREPGEPPRELKVAAQPISQPFGQRFLFEGSSLAQVKDELMKILTEEFERP